MNQFDADATAQKLHKLTAGKCCERRKQNKKIELCAFAVYYIKHCKRKCFMCKQHQLNV